MTTPFESSIDVALGDEAPAFSTCGHLGCTVSLAEFAGRKNVILAFYPKDDTPGCTQQMCSLSDALEEFKELDTVVLGISCDGVESHRRFAAKYGLTVCLLDDTSGEIGSQYGAVRGDRTMGDRILFLIDKQGVVRYRHEGMPDVAELTNVVRAIASASGA